MLRKTCSPMQTRQTSLRYLFLFLLVLLVSLLLVNRMKLTFSPPTPSLSLQVTIEYRGASEREIERLITIPLENALSEVRGVKEIFSLTGQERCRVHLVLAEGSSLEEGYLETRDRVERLYADLPRAVQRPHILQSDPSGYPVFIAAFPRNGRVSEEELKRRFESIPGVGEVEIGGSAKEEFLIRWLPDRIGRLKQPPAAASTAVLHWNVTGGCDSEDKPTLTLRHHLFSAEQLAEVPLGPTLRIKDIAEVLRREVPQERVSRVNGKEFLVLSVRPSGDGNLIELSRHLRAITSRVPGSTILLDAGAKAKQALQDLLLSLGIGCLAVVCVTTLFLKRVLPSLLTCLSIPFSAFFSLAVLDILGKSLDLSVLSALTVGSGMVIDAGVIVTETYLNGRPRSDGAILSRVKGPILLSALTTLVVFLPLLYATPVVRSSFETLAITLSAELGASLLYNLTFLPVFLRSSYRPGEHASPTGRAREGWSLLTQWVRALSRFRFPLAISAILFGVSGIYALLTLPPERKDHPSPETLEFLVEFDSGVPLEQVIERAGPLEMLLKGEPGVTQVRVTYERERATFACELSGPESKRLIALIQDQGRALSQGFLYFPSRGDWDEGGADVSVLFLGPDMKTVQDTATAFARSIRNGIPGEIIFHYKEPRREKRILLDPARARHLDVSLKTAREAFQLRFSAPVIDKTVLTEGETDIRLTLGAYGNLSLSELLSLPLTNRGAEWVRLSDLATLEDSQRIDRVIRANRRRSASFTVRTTDRDPLPMMNALREAASRYPFPEGVTVEIGKEWEETRARTRHLGGLLALSLFFIASLLLIYYEEPRYPILIMLQIPLFLSIPAWVLRLSRFSFSISIAMGFLLASGIGINNSLLVFSPRKPKGGGLKERLRGATAYYPEREGDRGNASPPPSPLEAFASHARSMVAATLTTLAGVLPAFFRGLLSGGPVGFPAFSDTFGALSLVLTGGSAGSLLVLIGTVILLEPREPTGLPGRRLRTWRLPPPPAVSERGASCAGDGPPPV